MFLKFLTFLIFGFSFSHSVFANTCINELETLSQPRTQEDIQNRLEKLIDSSTRDSDTFTEAQVLEDFSNLIGEIDTEVADFLKKLGQSPILSAGQNRTTAGLS